MKTIPDRPLETANALTLDNSRTLPAALPAAFDDHNAQNTTAAVPQQKRPFEFPFFSNCLALLAASSAPCLAASSVSGTPQDESLFALGAGFLMGCAAFVATSTLFGREKAPSLVGAAIGSCTSVHPYVFSMPAALAGHFFSFWLFSRFQNWRHSGINAGQPHDHQA